VTSFFCRLAGITAWLIVVCSSSLAAAQSAQVLIEQGLALREQGRDEQALPLFEQAFAQDPSGRPEAQLGLVQLGLGLFVQAEAHLRSALSSSDPWVEQNRTPLQQAQASAMEHLGTLEILGGVEGASLSVNGEAVGTLPYAAALSVLVGACTIDATADGYRRFSTEVVIRAGERARVTVNLVPIPQEQFAAGSPAREMPPVRPSDVTSEGWFWPVVLGGSALVIGGVILGVVLGTQSDLESDNLGGVFAALEASF